MSQMEMTPQDVCVCVTGHLLCDEMVSVGVCVSGCVLNSEAFVG